jgi:serine/threonine protein kinase
LTQRIFDRNHKEDEFTIVFRKRSGKARNLYERFHLAEVLGEGSFGRVNLYQSDSGMEVVAKVGTRGSSSLERDIAVIDLLGNSCDKVKSYHFKWSNRDVILMERMDGDLLQFKSQYLDEQSFLVQQLSISLILLDLVGALRCLYEHDLYYTDMKSENVLFSCRGGKLVVTLGDLGSAFPAGWPESIATYANHLRTRGPDPFVPTVYDVIFGLVVIFYDLNDGDYRYISWKIEDPPFDQDREISLENFYQQLAERYPVTVRPALDRFWEAVFLRDPSRVDDATLFDRSERSLKRLVAALRGEMSPEDYQEFSFPEDLE